MTADSSAARVTVGMPVYNAEAYLAESIEAVLAQTFTDWHLVVCDNASTDGTLDIARGHAESDRRISVLASDVNGGQVANFRRAFEAARGPLFMWLSDDDLLHPDYLARCVKALDDDPALIGAYTAADEIDEHGHHTGAFVDGPNPQARVDPDPAVRLREAVIAEPALSFFGVYRAEVLRRTDLLAPFVGSDRVLAGHLAMLGPIAQLPDRLFQRRTHASSYSHARFSNRRKFRSYCGRDPSWFRPLGWERIARLAGAVGRSDLSWSGRLRCYRVVLTTFLWWTCRAQLLIAFRFVSHWLSRLTGTELELHRAVVAAAKRARDTARVGGASHR